MNREAAAALLRKRLRDPVRRTADGAPVLALRNGRALAVAHGPAGWIVTEANVVTDEAVEVARPRTFNELLDVVLRAGAEERS